jgi:Domain of unknown function (DUF1707)
MINDPSFRASDEDRERVVGVLREQMVAGRLTSEELDERVGAAYAAKTWTDLRGLVNDLPVTLHFADERVPAAPPVAVRPVRHRQRRSSPLVPIAFAWLAIVILGDRIIFVTPLIVFALIITIIVVCYGRWARRL